MIKSREMAIAVHTPVNVVITALVSLRFDPLR